MSAFRVRLDCFEGPLDLLVQLVRAEELDPLAFAVAEILAAYLAHLESARGVDWDDVGDFLVLASTLLEVKSRLLLPTSEPEDLLADQPTKREVVRQLLEYKRFKEAAALLWERARHQQRKLGRFADDVAPAARDPAAQPIRELELWDLVSAFSRLMKENVVPVAERIVRDPTPLPVYMEQLEARVLATGGISFRDLLGLQNTRAQLIGKFLALLELVKSRRVWLELNERTDELLLLPPSHRPVPPAVLQPSMPMADASVPPDVLPPTPNADDASGDWEDDLAWDPFAPSAAEDTMLDGAPRASAWEDFEPLVEADDTLPAPDAWSDTDQYDDE